MHLGIEQVRCSIAKDLAAGEGFAAWRASGAPHAQVTCMVKLLTRFFPGSLSDGRGFVSCSAACILTRPSQTALGETA